MTISNNSNNDQLDNEHGVHVIDLDGDDSDNDNDHYAMMGPDNYEDIESDIEDQFNAMMEMEEALDDMGRNQEDKEPAAARNASAVHGDVLDVGVTTSERNEPTPSSSYIAAAAASAGAAAAAEAAAAGSSTGATQGEAEARGGRAPNGVVSDTGARTGHVAVPAAQDHIVTVGHALSVYSLQSDVHDMRALLYNS